MKYAYYPGCSGHGTSVEYEASTRAVCRALNMDLVEIEDWNCCGSTPAHSVSHELSAALENAENFPNRTESVFGFGNLHQPVETENYRIERIGGQVDCGCVANPCRHVQPVAPDYRVCDFHHIFGEVRRKHVFVAEPRKVYADSARAAAEFENLRRLFDKRQNHRLFGFPQAHFVDRARVVGYDFRRFEIRFYFVGFHTIFPNASVSGASVVLRPSMSNGRPCGNASSASAPSIFGERYSKAKSAARAAQRLSHKSAPPST